MKLVGIKGKDRFYFYSVIILIHVVWFYVSNEIPSRVDAIILMTLYLMMFSDSIVLEYRKEVKSE